MGLEATSIRRHARTPENHDVGTVFVTQRLGHRDDSTVRNRLVCEIENTEIERKVAGHPRSEPKRLHPSDMTIDGLLEQRHDAERPTARDCHCHGALGDTEHRDVETFACIVETRVAVTGNDERIAASHLGLHQRTHRFDHLRDVIVGLHRRRSGGEGMTLDLRATGQSKRIETGTDVVGHRGRGVRIDDDDPAPHVEIVCPSTHVRGISDWRSNPVVRP